MKPTQYKFIKIYRQSSVKNTYTKLQINYLTFLHKWVTIVEQKLNLKVTWLWYYSTTGERFNTALLLLEMDLTHIFNKGESNSEKKIGQTHTFNKHLIIFV